MMGNVSIRSSRCIVMLSPASDPPNASMVTMGGALQTHLQNKSNQKYQDLILENGAQQTIKEERAHGLLPLVIQDQAIH